MENFGKILKEKRLQGNFSLKEVSERTKIRIYILEAMEAGDTSALPPIYFKSFIKTYCDFLGVDKKLIPETVNPQPSEPEISHEENTNKKPTKKKKILVINDEEDIDHEGTDFDLETSNEKPNPLANIIIYASIGLIVTAALYFGIFQTLFDIKKESQVVAYDESTEVADTALIGSESSLFKDIKPPEPDSITLVAKATGEAWLRIIIDGKKVEEVYMKPGMEKRWAAKVYYELTQGNVGAVQYYRNDQLLEPFGMKGTVVRNVRITKTQLKNITKSEQDSIKAYYYQKRKPKKKKQRKPILIEPANFDESFINKNKKEKKLEPKQETQTETKPEKIQEVSDEIPAK